MTDLPLDHSGAASPAAASGRRREAFTLVELLTVVALLALLVTILMPTLTRAVNLTRTAVCQSNLHQVGLAATAYQSSNAMGAPWLFSDRTGDNPDETKDTDLFPHLPGNPAWPLVEDANYLPTPKMFFCPQSKRNYENGYDAKAVGNKIWGTYTWYWEHIPQPEARQRGMFHDPASGPVPPGKYHNENGDSVGDEKSRQLVMAEPNPCWTWWAGGSKPAYQHYCGLFIDQHVELICKDESEFSEWLWGSTGPP